MHMDQSEALNAPQAQPPASPTTAVHHPLVAASGEQCPSCGNPVASDQRYCLNCGQRCGEPRLPFMNAVTFMEVMNRPAVEAPPPPKRKQRRLSPNAALIAGVGTLLLAMGVGVLIGSSGNDTASAPEQQAPIVIEKGGGGEESAAVTTTGSGGKTSGKKSKKAAAKAKEKAESGAGAEEILKPAGDVKLPPATVQPGGKCPPGSAGCKGGEFTGNFFE